MNFIEELLDQVYMISFDEEVELEELMIGLEEQGIVQINI